MGTRSWNSITAPARCWTPIKAAGVEDNTIVLWLSDNGAAPTSGPVRFQALEERGILGVRTPRSPPRSGDTEASREWATGSFSSAESDIPSPCMPSRRVVS